MHGHISQPSKCSVTSTTSTTRAKTKESTVRIVFFSEEERKPYPFPVRNRSRELVELLSDVEKIRAERRKAKANKSKYIGVGNDGLSHGSMSFESGGGGRYGGFGSDSLGGGGGSSYGGNYSNGMAATLLLIIFLMLSDQTIHQVVAVAAVDARRSATIAVNTKNTMQAMMRYHILQCGPTLSAARQSGKRPLLHLPLLHLKWTYSADSTTMRSALQHL